MLHPISWYCSRCRQSGVVSSENLSWMMIEGFARKDAWQTSGLICDYKAWGCLSNLRHFSLYCCILKDNSSADALPIAASLQFTCCHWAMTSPQWRSHLRHARAEESCLRCAEFLHFEIIKNTGLIGRFSLEGLSVTQPSHVLQRAKACRKQGMIL